MSPTRKQPAEQVEAERRQGGLGRTGTRAGAAATEPSSRGVGSPAPRFAPPYTVVIFTSTRTEGDDGYTAMAQRMDALAAEQPGYLGVESARDPDTGVGITVSYWRDEAAALAWKSVHEHVQAQVSGRRAWYRDYTVRIATVHRDYTSRDHSDAAEQVGITPLPDPR